MPAREEPPRSISSWRRRRPEHQAREGASPRLATYRRSTTLTYSSARYPARTLKHLEQVHPIEEHRSSVLFQLEFMFAVRGFVKEPDPTGHQTSLCLSLRM